MTIEKDAANEMAGSIDFQKRALTNVLKGIVTNKTAGSGGGRRKRGGTTAAEAAAGEQGATEAPSITQNQADLYNMEIVKNNDMRRGETVKSADFRRGETGKDNQHRRDVLNQEVDEARETKRWKRGEKSKTNDFRMSEHSKDAQHARELLSADETGRRNRTNLGHAIRTAGAHGVGSMEYGADGGFKFSGAGDAPVRAREVIAPAASTVSKGAQFNK